MDPKEENTKPGNFLKQVNFPLLLKNKSLMLGVLICLSTMLMFGYIIVVPSNIKKTVIRSLTYQKQAQPTQAPTQPVPTPTLIPEDTISPTIYNAITPTLTPSPTPSPTPTVTPTPDPFATWRTYRNTTYRYKIKYPPNWTVRNFGALEPKIPNYIIFNPTNASAGARSITISGSTRTYEEQTAIDGLGTPLIVANTAAVKQNFQDSYGQRSTAITIPRTGYLIILRSKTAHLTTFNQMLTTLQLF